jgi:hypothetical protein
MGFTLKIFQLAITRCNLDVLLEFASFNRADHFDFFSFDLLLRQQQLFSRFCHMLNLQNVKIRIFNKEGFLSIISAFKSDIRRI